jgi:hypothetical protein
MPKAARPAKHIDARTAGPTWTTEIVALTAHRSASPDESTSAPVEV